MSIFNDKALKGVAEAVSKVMQQEELKGNQHKIDANKNGKIDAHDFKMLRGKKDMKKEEAELEEASGLIKGVKRFMAGKKNPSDVRDAHLAKSAFSSDPKVKEKEGRRYDKVQNILSKEEVELDEAFPTVADAKKRMDAGKTASGSVTKTKTGLVHKRDYKDDDSAEDTQKKSTGYGARQNFKRSTRVNEAASFTEMLEMYNEYGIKVLAPIKTQEEKVGDQTFDVLDADKFNGFVETTIEEEATNDEFTKELKDQEASFLGKKKQPKLTTGKTTGVKEMPESVELEERELSKDEAKKKEEYVKGMKKGLSGFKDRYGERAKSVMYATATKMAKKD